MSEQNYNIFAFTSSLHLTEEEYNDDKEFFNERYNEKKRKFNKIKKLMGDEIDEELNNARKRLHEDISLRIKYFEEKEMLTLIMFS